MVARHTTILVHPGIGCENIDFLGKRIHLTGIDPGSLRAPYPTIEGIVARFANGEDPDSTLTGFVIADSQDRSDGAILCSSSSGTIANCLIAGHRSTDVDCAAVSCTDSNAVLVNRTIADNYAGKEGAGLSLCSSSVTVVNSILWGNVPREIVSIGQARAPVRYSSMVGGWPGLGSISFDPPLTSPGYWVDPRDAGVVVGADRPEAIF